MNATCNANTLLPNARPVQLPRPPPYISIQLLALHCVVLMSQHLHPWHGLCELRGTFLHL
jgi:hypothetical protein